MELIILHRHICCYNSVLDTSLGSHKNIFFNGELIIIKQVGVYLCFWLMKVVSQITCESRRWSAECCWKINYLLWCKLQVIYQPLIDTKSFTLNRSICKSQVRCPLHNCDYFCESYFKCFEPAKFSAGAIITTKYFTGEITLHVAQTVNTVQLQRCML